jgi:CheY-like chemotaxis protein
MPATQGLPIIALSGMAMEVDQQRCKEVGSNAFLAKPYKMVELKEYMCEILEIESGGIEK